MFESGGWEVDLARRELRARGLSIPIGGRAFEIIEALVRASGALVTKDDLMRRVWPGIVVEDNTLQVHISAIRKALGADRGMLKTISGRGYRLLGDWTIRPESAPPMPEPPEPVRTAARPYLTNVPVAASALIGRETAVQHLRDLVSAYRVVTLTGPGGIGKTVLASEVARRLFPTLESDVFFVELASLSISELVPSSVAYVLNLQLRGDEMSPESVARAIGSKKVLLILDNCEHVIETAARMAETLVRLCPHATVLATSREVLRVEGEFVYRVPALDVPSPHMAAADEALEHSAVQLFVARTRALRADFRPQGDSLPVIAAICRQLDGIPLAIEFAAARAATLGVEQVAGRLDDRFALLTGGRRTALPQHQTLRATLDWSYDLLPEAERRLLRRLAIFPAGFTLEAATAVAGNIESSVALGISSLVSKSLLTLDGSEAGATAYHRLLDTTRAYALQKLTDASEVDPISRSHANHYRALFERAEAEWETRPTVNWLADYGRQIDNLRAALDWAFSLNGDATVGVALTVAAVPLWFQLSLVNECRGRVERALAALDRDARDDAQSAMKLHAALGWSLMFTTEHERPTSGVWQTALALAEDLDDVDYQLRALWGLYASYYNKGEFREVLALAERFSTLAVRSADPADPHIGDRMMGVALHFLGQQTDARRHIERMLSRYVAPGHRSDIVRFQFEQRVTARITLARVLWLQGFADQALRAVASNIDDALAIEHTLSLCNVLANAACPVALLAGDLVAAERYTAMLSSQSERHALDNWHAYADIFRGELLVRRGHLDTGLSLLHTSISRLRPRFAQYHTAFLGVLAESLARAGRLNDGRAAVDEALQECGRTEACWCMSELLRIDGEIALLEIERDAGLAEQKILEALGWARRQQALSWELRSAMSLARFWRDRNRTDEARELLGGVYRRFTEGFETADLKAAKSLLKELG